MLAQQEDLHLQVTAAVFATFLILTRNHLLSKRIDAINFI
jgi:hypothetical protein